MGIIIKKISVKNLGPIKEKGFNEEFGLLNLIYSKNEMGKSFLTEFIIASLFKNAKDWGLRDGVRSVRGNVIVGGLSEKDIEFSPESRKKLEDFIEKERGLPPSLKKLLVVKGGEVKIDEKEGVNRPLLTEILSGKQVLEKIDKKIDKTKIKDKEIGSSAIKDAEIKANTINIKNQGIGKEYYNILEELNKIQKLWDDIISSYKVGKLKGLEKEKCDIEKNLKTIVQAKKYRAYELSRQIDELKEHIEPYINILPEIKTSMAHYQKEKNKFVDDKNNYQELKKEVKDCSWIKKAKEIYSDLTGKITVMPKKALLLMGIASEILAIIAAISGIKLPAVSFIIIGLGFLIFYFWKQQVSLKSIGDNKELDKLKQEFRQKIGKELMSIVDFDEKLEECTKNYGRLAAEESRLQDTKKDFQDTKDGIIDRFQELTGKMPDEEKWDKIIKTLEVEKRRIEKEIKEKERELQALAVRPEDFLEEVPDIEYSKEEEKKVGDKYENIKGILKNEEEAIKDLKKRVQGIIGDETIENWNELIEKLREKKEKIEKELEEIEAKIIGKNIVHKVIEEFQEDEDEKIQEGLRADKIVRLLSGLTDGHYNRVEWEEEGGLKIGNDFENFYLNALSTGAREQVMLALRIGFASKLLGNENMFLILDDAFQHTDWERRENLVKNQISELVNKGWQIIYLTMDDHIKGLFNEVGTRQFEDKYKYIQF